MSINANFFQQRTLLNQDFSEKISPAKKVSYVMMILSILMQDMMRVNFSFLFGEFCGSCLPNSVCKNRPYLSQVNTDIGLFLRCYMEEALSVRSTLMLSELTKDISLSLLKRDTYKQIKTSSIHFSCCTAS